VAETGTFLMWYDTTTRKALTENNQEGYDFRQQEKSKFVNGAWEWVDPRYAVP
jgi:hypothetical protein